jgi:hypothetical protein
MRTLLSEKQVAMIGRSGCADVSQARENEGGLMVIIWFSMIEEEWNLNDGKRASPLNPLKLVD